MTGYMVWVLLLVAWAQVGLFIWAMGKLYHAEKEKEEAVNWCAAHMLYEKEKGYPLMETDRMDSYYHRARMIREGMKKGKK